MVVHVDAVAYSSPLPVFCFVFLYILLCVLLRRNTTVCWAKPTYSHQDQLSLGLCCGTTILIMSYYHRFHNIPEDIARTLGSPWVVLPGGKPKRR